MVSSLANPATQSRGHKDEGGNGDPLHKKTMFGIFCFGGCDVR